MSDRYQIVRLANGEYSVRSNEHHETFHPVIGPAAEAQALYVGQLKLPERIAHANGPFVIWDIGLGAAANPLTLLNAVRDLHCQIQIVSFDCTSEPLRFALEHPEKLPFLTGFIPRMRELIEMKAVKFQLGGGPEVNWEFHLGDFPTLLTETFPAGIAKPHAIFYDAFSPKKNPGMWTLPVFAKLHSLLDPGRECSLATYSRSTLLRVTLLLAGFYVGAGHATGEKEETTIATNRLETLSEPLGAEWLDRARRSTSAEPLQIAEYQQKPLSNESWEMLAKHPQFRGRL